MDNKEINELMQGLTKLQEKSVEMINGSLDVETFNALPIEKQNLINEAKKGLDFSGKESLSSRLNHLKITLQQNGM